MIRTEGLTKLFNQGRNQPSITAVEDLTLQVEEGEVFGFLGPNGAGKTTTVRMLACLIGMTRGRAWINGYEVGRDDQAIRQSVGLLTETPGMYDRLSAERNLTLFARLYNVSQPAARVEKYLRMLGLWDRRMDEVGSFSKGMRQKLAIARALLHEPRLVFLDEPTSGLDPEAAKLVRDFIEELKTAGRTIFLCTHNLDEADRLCDRIAIFKTRLVTVDSPANLRQKLYGRSVVIHLAELQPGWVDLVRSLPFVREARAVENRLVIRLDNPEEQNPVIIQQLVQAGGRIQFVGELRHSLEDVYLKMIGN
ncbi:MAG TPA: ABC transporter ATP-binding protein [Anaerolineaceae bacterium]|jgi:ABC-2 type transport system ATP-binding protein|nr:ABC transporter ATP-binding protein [Anaerolineaceae bacterium]NMD30728.1 ABC transporter ATP-binding protein [Chloroflexota bacterium]HNZ00596.1 ABC transporter ATP-binding protein [Anaerolineaceae bacterium]HOH19902.1 ABC transporter ATP-binding protein [Anaerolineaceae bacterium]HPA32189.1 ABC transporter ATP-binding protein [Anaerolineaceae bacterium]